MAVLQKVPEFRTGLSFGKQRERERDQRSHVINVVSGTKLVPIYPSGADEDKLFSATICCVRTAFVCSPLMQLWACVKVLKHLE